ncbi:hypothetical protein KXD40_009070 [Peronospora effusa]|nr:hypothetical protein KXD40_009070 [Peronospora effusa]
MGMYKEVIKNCTKLLKNSTENLGWYCTKVTASEDGDAYTIECDTAIGDEQDIRNLLVVVSLRLVWE